jgi:RNA polymerase sigma factor (sigma-70 family)
MPDATASCSTAAAAMNGDMSAVHALWQEHRRWVAAVLLAYKPRSVELDDLLQDVAMTLIAKINTVREEGNVRAWLRSVAVNAARAAARMEKSRPALRVPLSDVDCADGAQSDDADGLSEHAARIIRLACQLPEQYREPLLLKAVQGMRTRQISEIMGIPEATVDTRISRARKMIREQINAQSTEQEVML